MFTGQVVLGDGKPFFMLKEKLEDAGPVLKMLAAAGTTMSDWLAEAGAGRRRS